MSEQTKRGVGRPQQYSEELLLEAGANVARRGAASRNQRLRLSDLLDVRLNDVLEEAARLAPSDARRGSLSAPVIYRKWPDFNAYVSDLVAYVFTPTKLDFTPLEDPSLADWESRLRAYAQADQAQMGVDTSLWFSLFGGANLAAVSIALARVYENYDIQVLPKLDAFLREAGLELVVPTEDLARMLTALTEGFGLRQLVDPVEARADNYSLWGEAAVALVKGLRRE